MRLGIWWIRNQIEKATTSPDSAQARHVYQAWVKRRLEQFDMIAVTSVPATYDLEAMDHALAAGAYERAVEQRLGGPLAAFRAELKEGGHEPERIELAVRRIIEPLLDARLAGGIERLVGNYSKRGRFSRDLKAFVDQGIRRERFILDRKPFDRIEVSEGEWVNSDRMDPDG